MNGAQSTLDGCRIHAALERAFHNLARRRYKCSHRTSDHAVAVPHTGALGISEVACTPPARDLSAHNDDCSVSLHKQMLLLTAVDQHTPGRDVDGDLAGLGKPPLEFTSRNLEHVVYDKQCRQLVDQRGAYSRPVRRLPIIAPSWRCQEMCTCRGCEHHGRHLQGVDASNSKSTIRALVSAGRSERNLQPSFEGIDRKNGQLHRHLQESAPHQRRCLPS